MPIPKHDDLLNPVLQAMKRLGGSASIQELNLEVVQTLDLTDEELAEPHGNRGTEVEYWLAWARSYLKIYDLLDNSTRGIWSLTANGRDCDAVDPRTVLRFVNGRNRSKRKQGGSHFESASTALESDVPIETGSVEDAETLLAESWRDELLQLLLELSPDTFERLCQRVLRESGFVEVKVTGRPGDGGIDGVGIVRIHGLLSFPVFFQCKRYRGNVGPRDVRDFRGAMAGRGDRGIFITTGTFTPDAKTEATRDGTARIDLVDGDQLLDKLKELTLGVKVEMIEKVSVMPEFFRDM